MKRKILKTIQFWSFDLFELFCISCFIWAICSGASAYIHAHH